MKTSLLLRKHLLSAGGLWLLAVSTSAALTIQINFGTATSVSGWNSLGTTGTPSIADLLDVTGTTTGISLATTGDIAGSQYSTSNGVTGTGLYPDAVTNSYIYEGPNSGSTFGVITLSGLDTGQQYEVTVFAARGGISDTRVTDFTLTGLTNETISQTVTNNTSADSFAALLPAGDGTLALDFRSNGTDYGYLNAMVITAVPEPGTFALFAGLMALGAIVVRRRLRS